MTVDRRGTGSGTAASRPLSGRAAQALAKVGTGFGPVSRDGASAGFCRRCATARRYEM